MITKPAHFEILTLNTGELALTEAFPTYDAAHKVLTEDPLISANANHPYFWGNFFEIVLCGGDDCKLTPPTNSASL
jgi:hypothetical protein